jgi:tetratricopeptide (TPR) repeat protein
VSRRRLPRLLLAFLIVSFASATAERLRAQAPAANDPGTRVFDYLKGLGLDRVAAVHLENELRGTTDEAHSKRLARELADLYASLLTEPGIDEQEFARRSQTLDRLVKEFPAVDSPSLAIIRLQGEFTRGEEALNLWLADANDLKSYEVVKSIFPRIGPTLAEASLRLDAERKALQTQADQAETASPELDRQLASVTEAWNRAHFFAGWAEYYRWLVTERADRPALEASIGAFERFLGVAGEKYPDVRPDWLALEAMYRSRAAIGLELALLALGDTARADMVHQWLQHYSVPASLRDELANWRLSGFLNAHQWKEAIDYAQTTIGAFTPEPTQGKVNFCVTLVRRAFATPDVPPIERARLAELGIGRLARMRVFNVLDELVDRYDIGDEALGDGFYVQYLAAERAFEAAEKSKEPADYDKAIAGYEAALARPEAAEDPSLRGDALYRLGHALYGRERMKEAAEKFESAWKALKEAGRSSTGEAAWMTFVAYYELGKTDKSFYDAALSALERIVAEMPESETGKKARDALPRLRSLASPPQDALAAWKKIPEGDPKFDEAQREIAKLYGRMSAEAKDAATRERIRAEANVFVSAALDSKASPETKLEAALLGGRLSATAAEPDWKGVASMLDRAAGALATAPANSPPVREWHALRMNAAAKTEDAARARREAEWISTNAAGTPQERIALILQAQNAAKWEIPADKLDAIYEQIASSATPEELAGDKNARAAHYRLAVKAQQSGNLEDAERRLALLLKAQPDELNYLLLQARVLFAREKYVPARDLALKVLRGLSSKDDRWWEAKYLQVASLAQTDPPGAEKVYRQFRLLYPEIPDAAMRERFEELAANWNSP